jgi:chromosome segregation ATPase
MSFNPAELLRETLESFSIETDLDTIDRIQESLKILQSERDKELQVTQAELLQLSTALKTQEETISELVNDPKRHEVKDKLKENAKLEFEYSKSLKGLTYEKQELNSKLSQLVDEFTRLENDLDSLQSATGDANHEDQDLDSVVLKLMVYRKLGLKLDTKSKTAIIFNKEKNLTDFLNYSDEKYSDYFISNYIWDRIGG